MIGRIVRLGSGEFGLEARFDNMPGGVRVPPSLHAAGVSATITRFKLEVGAVRRMRHNFRRVIPTPTGSITVQDHVLIGYHLVTRPTSCPSARLWPWELLVDFPEGQQQIRGTVPCGS